MARHHKIAHLVLPGLLLAACTGEVGDTPPGGDGAADGWALDHALDLAQLPTDSKVVSRDGQSTTDSTPHQDKGGKKDTTPPDSSAYLHANVWSVWWNDRTRCGAERTFLRICQQRGGTCSTYQQALNACNPKKIVNGQVGPEKQGESLCQQSKYPSVGGCVAASYDFAKLRFWWYGAEWQSNWPVATIKIFSQGADWKGGGELIALSNVPGATQAAMSGIKNHGLGFGCAMAGKTTGSKADKYRRPFGGFAWIKVPTNQALTVAALSASNFAGYAFAGCNRGSATQSPWISGAPGATMGCIHVLQNVTFKPGCTTTGTTARSSNCPGSRRPRSCWTASSCRAWGSTLAARTPANYKYALGTGGSSFFSFRCATCWPGLCLCSLNGTEQLTQRTKSHDPQTNMTRSAAMKPTTYTIAIFVAAAMTLPGVAVASPKTKKLEQGHTRGYTKARFDKADTNGDGLVSRQEAGAEARPVEKRLKGSKRFSMADRNGDGALTLEEAAAQKRREKRLYRFAKAHPKTFKRLVKQLVKHPRMARKLTRLALDNPRMAKTLVKAMVNHPQASKALLRAIKNNPAAASKLLRAMKNNPGAARALVKAATRHPAMTKKLLSAAVKHPRAARQIIKLAMRNPRLSRKLISSAMAHPRAAKKVMRWMVKHPRLARKLIKLHRQNPAAARKLAKKLRNQ